QKLAVRDPGDVDVHAEHVAELARQQVYAQYGDKAYTSGMKVVTTLRARDQQAAWRAVRKTLIDRELGQPWRGPEDQLELEKGLADADIAEQLRDADDDEMLRVAVVTHADPQKVRLVLASGDALEISGRGLRGAQAGLRPKAPSHLRIGRGAVVRLYQQGKNWLITQWPQAEGALVAMDPHNGEIRAMVGGFDFTHNQFNHVTQGWRQPGSTFKPFLYAAAMENGVMPETLVNDAPLTDVGNWAPQNADGIYD